MGTYYENGVEMSDKPGIKVRVYNNDVNKALRKLKTKIAADGLVRELRQREYYEKPGDKRRRKRAESIARTNKARRMKERFGDF